MVYLIQNHHGLTLVAFDIEHFNYADNHVLDLYYSTVQRQGKLYQLIH